MRMITFAVALLGISAPLLECTAALAQNNRSWVSRTGNDANFCRIVDPCRLFQRAHNQTSANGVINCVDAADYGVMTISRSIEIDCLQTTASILAGGDALTINTAGITVVLRGLSIQGVGFGGIGVNITAAATVHLEKVTIRNFRAGSAAGVRVSNTTGLAEVYISDSHITDNGTGAAGGGIFSVPSGSAFSLVELRNVNVKKNTFGAANTANSRMRISHASFAGNTVGIHADPGAIVTLNDVDIVYSNTGISGATTTYGNNRIAGNNSDGTPPTPAGAQSHELGQR